MKSQSAALFTCLNYAYLQQRAARRRSKMPQSPDQSPQHSAAGEKLHDKNTEPQKKQPTTASDKQKQTPTTGGDKLKQTATANDKQKLEASSAEDNKVKADQDTDRGTLIRSDSIESNCSSVSVSSCSQPSQPSRVIATT